MDYKNGECWKFLLEDWDGLIPVRLTQKKGVVPLSGCPYDSETKIRRHLCVVRHLRRFGSVTGRKDDAWWCAARTHYVRCDLTMKLFVFVCARADPKCGTFYIHLIRIL